MLKYQIMFTVLIALVMSGCSCLSPQNWGKSSYQEHSQYSMSDNMNNK